MLIFACLCLIELTLMSHREYMMHRWFVLKQGSPDLFWLFTLCIWMVSQVDKRYQSIANASSVASLLR